MRNNTTVKKKILTNTLTVCFLAVFCCVLWGSAFPCIKLGYKLFSIGSLETGSQILFAGVRFFLAGIMVIVIGSIAGKKILFPAKKTLPEIAVLALLQTVVQYTFFYIGLAHTSGVNGSIIQSSGVFFTILAAALIFHQEKLTFRKAIGCVIGFIGVVIINFSDGINTDISFTGDGFLFLSAASNAFSSCCIKIFSKNENPVLLSGYQFMSGGIVMIAVGAAMGGHIVPGSVLSYPLLAYMAFISAAAYSLWGILLKYNPVSKVSVFKFATPVFGVILSAVILGEISDAFGSKSIAALIFITAGIFILNTKKTQTYN